MRDFERFNTIVMLLKFIDDKIRRAFSDAAVQYDVLTGLHKEIGRELLAKAAAHEGNGPILDWVWFPYRHTSWTSVWEPGGSLAG